MKLSLTLKDLVRERGLTHGQIANRLRQKGTPLSRPFITQMINGTKKPSERSLRLLVEELGCELITQTVTLNTDLKVAVKIVDGEIKEQYGV